MNNNHYINQSKYECEGQGIHIFPRNCPPPKSFYKGGWVVVYFKCLLTSALISFIWIFSKLVQIKVSLEQFLEKSWYSAKHVKKGICEKPYISPTSFIESI